MDFGIGILLLTFSLAPLIRELFGYVYIPVILLAPAVIVIGNRYLIAPRVDVVKFSRQRVKKQKRFRSIALIALAATFVMVVLTLLGVFPDPAGGVYFIISIGAAVIVGMGIFAHIRDFPKLFIYGIIIGGGVITAELLYGAVGTPLDSLISFGITGTGLTVYGIFELNRFLKKYPKPDVI